jgi:hypothetical protein
MIGVILKFQIILIKKLKGGWVQSLFNYEPKTHGDCLGIYKNNLFNIYIYIYIF